MIIMPSRGHLSFNLMFSILLLYIISFDKNICLYYKHFKKIINYKQNSKFKNMSTNIHQNPTPPILTAYSFNNNPTMLSSYQSTPYYKTSSLMATPQFQPPSPFYTNPPSQQTLDNVTSSFGLGNHIESIPMANSIFRS